MRLPLVLAARGMVKALLPIAKGAAATVAGKATVGDAQVLIQLWLVHSSKGAAVAPMI